MRQDVVGAKKMESIYEYIDKNIKANGMLKDN